MKISLNEDEVVSISDFVGNIWITNKLDGQWMYGTLPEKIFPDFAGGVATFLIPIKYRKYGDVWQLNGITSTSEVEVEGNIHLIKKNPVQFKIARDIPMEKIESQEVSATSVKLSRPLANNERILVKRRINTNYGNAYFSKKYIFEEKDNNLNIRINDIVKKLDIVEGDIVDFFIKNELTERKLPVINIPGNWYLDTKNGMSYRIYRTGINTLAIYFYSEKSIYVDSLAWKNSKLFITLPKNIVATDLSDFEVVEATKKSADSSIREGVPVHSYVENEQIVIDDEFFHSEMDRRNKFGFRLFFSYKGSMIKNQFRTNGFEKFISNSDYYFQNKSDKIFLCVELIRKKRDDVTRVAVLGSSHTRPMFRSDDYFNPYYKNYYDVVYTQFHSSIISLVGKKREYKDNYFSSRNSTVKKYIQTDFEKSFFESLKEAKPDFLIIDIYIDVQMGVIYFGDGTVISYNSYQAESNYVLEHLDNKTKLSTIFNDDNYMKNFSSALETFRRRILNVLPEDRIIIHSFDMSEDYRDKDNSIRKYSQSQDSIVELNEVAVEMQLLLEKTFPKAFILDIRDSNYHGGKDNPLGNMPHHFESGYYREMLNELAKIVSLKK